MCETKKLCRLIEKKVSWRDKYRYSFARDIIIDIISEYPEKLSDIKKYYQYKNQLAQRENDNNVRFAITTIVAIISMFISSVVQLKISDNAKMGVTYIFIYILLWYIVAHLILSCFVKYTSRNVLFIADIVDSINASDLTAKKRN